MIDEADDDDTQDTLDRLVAAMAILENQTEDERTDERAQHTMVGERIGRAMAADDAMSWRVDDGSSGPSNTGGWTPSCGFRRRQIHDLMMDCLKTFLPLRLPTEFCRERVLTPSSIRSPADARHSARFAGALPRGEDRWT